MNSVLLLHIPRVRGFLLLAFGLSLAVLMLPRSAAAQALKVSQINPPGASVTASFGSAVNSTNQVVGNYVVGGVTKGFEYLGDTQYKTIVPPGANGFARANGINASGEIVGDFFGRDNFYHGFTLINGTYKQYDVQKGVLSTSIFGVNNNGDFAGAAGVGGGNNGFINVGGTVTQFSALGSSDTFALAINNLDQLVGVSFDSANNVHGYFRDASGTISEIAYPGAVQTACQGINDSGEITGYYIDASSQVHGFTLINGVYSTSPLFVIAGVNNAGTYTGYYIGPGPAGAQDYGYLSIPTSMTFTTVKVRNALSTSIYGINNGNVMVGFYTNAQGAVHGLKLSGNTATDIDDPNAQTGMTFCYNLNTAGTIVGYYVNSGNHSIGFVNTNGTFTDILPPGATDSFAQGINDSGVISGTYDDASGAQHGFTYNGSTYTTINVPGATYTTAWGINAGGQVTLPWVDSFGYMEASILTGSTYKLANVPGGLQSTIHSITKTGNVDYVWQDTYGGFHGGAMLNKAFYLFDPPSGTGTSARADGINDRNLMVGRYLLPDGVNFAGFKATIP